MMDGGGQPAVFAEWAGVPGKPTLIVYGHYDVQPADPLGLWKTPPSEPTERDGRLYARGASDVKGSTTVALESIGAFPTTVGELPCNVKLIGLSRKTAEYDPLAVVVADRSDELERPPLIAANRLHMPAVDGERDRSRFGLRSRGRQLHRVSLEPGADMQRPLADRLYLRGVAEREELIQ
jgi:hypothetical protein